VVIGLPLMVVMGTEPLDDALNDGVVEVRGPGLVKPLEGIGWLRRELGGFPPGFALSRLEAARLRIGMCPAPGGAWQIPLETPTCVTSPKPVRAGIVVENSQPKTKTARRFAPAGG